MKMQKNRIGVSIERNAFVDGENGLITFPEGQVITDDSQQRNGTKYDIESMDLSEYKGQVTADHVDMIDRVIGKALNVAKRANQVVIGGIQFAVKESALAKMAYDLMRGGFPLDLSIETYGPWPDESDDTYYKAKLIGLSVVVVGNNRSASMTQIARNSLEQAKEEGLDTSEAEKVLPVEQPAEPPKEEPKPAEASEDQPKAVTANNTKDNQEQEDMKFVTIWNSRDFAVAVKYKNAADKEVETELAPGASVDVSEDQKEAVETQLNAAQAPQPDVQELVSNAVKPILEQMEELRKEAFNKGAKEPELKKDEGVQTNGIKDSKNEFAAMPWEERHAKQINAAWDLLKRHDQSAGTVLAKLNEVNLAELKKDGIVRNSMTISDFGNFVISRELLTEIEGCRNDYTPLVNATSWRETLSTQFAWLKRSGDINMQNVEFCDDGADGNLKPISEYSASIQTSDLEELAAVTPVCNAATRFLAADLLGDVAAGYRNDYDRKRAQLVVARLEQAVEDNGNSVIYDTNPNVEALVALLNAWKEIANCTPNGTFVLNSSSYASILAYALRAGVSGPLSQIFTTGNQPTMFGRPYIVVSDDLMPSLDSAGTVSITVDGSTTVTVNHAVFYANLSNFTGRTSGGLQYDLSTQAAYEDSGTVKSAYQRNELVLRGSFFRGGAIKDTDQVSGILSPGVS